MTKIQAIEAVFFDLDGTMLDTASDFVFAVNQLLKDRGRPAMASDLIRNNVSAGSKVLTCLALNLPENHSDLEAERQHLLTIYEQHISNPERHQPASLYPGIENLLSELEQREIPWGIVTNKPEVYTTVLLKQVKLHQRTQVIICPDHVTRPKPDPEALFLACQQTNCSPSASIYIGDHKRDIDAGNKAAMTTIAALYGYVTDTDNPDTWQADFQASNVNDIHQWFTRQQWAI